MLYLVGLGLGDEKDLTQRAMETAKNSDCYIETYTNRWTGAVKALESLIDNKVTVLQRKDLEEDLEKFLDVASIKDTVLFICGDPLAATTHIEIFRSAKKRNIPVSIIHNASIFTAVAETGLQLYKFGRAATVTSNNQLQTVKDTVEGNQSLGLHTLLLLDIGMTPSSAAKTLMDNKVLDPETQVIFAAKLGTPNSIKKYTTLGEISEAENPAVIILPGKLHFVEEEFLNNL